ncbi:MAG: hypothetical protein ACOX6L_11500 [Syntrophomonadaceae bacterium]|jgi:glucan phosphoethanolaminetransferase (alkaline phosphatase superfamily)
MSGIIIAIYILIIIIEVPDLIKRQLYKELAVFTFLFVIGLYAGLAYYYNWPLTSIFDNINMYLERLSYG